MSEAELVVLTRPERIYLGVDVGRRHHVASAVSRSTLEEGDARWPMSQPQSQVDTPIQHADVAVELFEGLAGREAGGPDAQLR